MAVQQLTVPYTGGYDFGIGADLASGSPMGMVVVGEPTPVGFAPGATVDFQVQRIHSTTELEQALRVDVEMSYGCAAFGAGVSARFNFAKNSKVQTSSLFMTISAEVELAFLSIDDPALSPDASELVARPKAFQTRYGDMFVRGISRGGLFIGVLRVDTNSADESQEISGKLQGSYGLFSGEAKSKFQETLSKHKTEIFVRMYHEGGPTGLVMTDPQDPIQLLDNANRFIQSFQDTPDAVARPYSVKLAPTTIARGPDPPNAVDIQHAQDIILFCAKRRSVLLDQLNLLEYIIDNPGKFDFTQGASEDAVRKAAQDVQSDLDLVADCASAATNRPTAETMMPADFAVASGTTFPKAVLPDPMPLAKSGRTVIVPDFAVCTSSAGCAALAAQVGLSADMREVDIGSPFAVLDVSPPEGAPVAEGSAIVILTRNPLIFFPEMLVFPR